MTEWTVQRLAGFIRAESGSRLTLSEAWRIADALARGPLAEVWTDGVTEGRRRAQHGQLGIGVTRV